MKIVDNTEKVRNTERFEVGDIIYQNTYKKYLYITAGCNRDDFEIVVIDLICDKVYGKYSSLQDAYKDIHINSEYLVNAELVDKGQKLDDTLKY